MQEFLLFAHVPARRHDQVLNILSSVTASQPTPFREQHLIFAPMKASEPAGNSVSRRKTHANANLQRFYYNAYRDIGQVETGQATQPPWRLLINETPEAGVQNLITRTTSDFELQDPQRLTDSSMFTFVAQQIHSGHRFIQGHVVFKVVRLLLPKAPQESPFEATPPTAEQLKLLDPSGSYLIEASVKVEDRTNNKLTELASKELLDLEKMLQGSIELYAPDRLTLETRIKDV